VTAVDASPPMIRLAEAAVGKAGQADRIALRCDRMQTLLLAGVTLGILCNAGILFARHLAGPYGLYAIERWLIGGIEVIGYQQFAAMLPLLAPGLGLILLQLPSLNQLALGDDLAAGFGVDVQTVQRQIFIGGSVATGAVVAAVGPIGFVGLIVPHAVRRLTGYDGRLVLPAAFLAGGTFLVMCDTLARTLFYPTELPVGIITALAGGPFFLHLLLQETRRPLS
jgi:iron complex transport system permease protein